MSDSSATNPHQPPQKTLSHALGEITWLMTQSPQHKQLFIGDLEWFCMPALLHEQFRIYNGPNSPAAVALWAFVSDETEARLQSDGPKLRPEEWNGGENPWLIELVAPFGGQEEILADLAVTAFSGRTFKFHHVKSGRRSVATFDPATATLSPQGR